MTIETKRVRAGARRPDGVRLRRAGSPHVRRSAGARRVPRRRPAVGTIERLDPALDALVAPGAVIEKVAGGFKFTEGPLWRPDGTLWFSDVQGNVVRSVTPDGKVDGADSRMPAACRMRRRMPSSDRTAWPQAPDGSVWMAQHGGRQIVRVAPDRTLTPVVSAFEGKRFNSPNDLVFAKDGALYFTDPPYGLAKQDDDPAKELSLQRRLSLRRTARVQALVRDLNRPNGLAFSPDFKVLYVNNSDPAKNLVMRYDVAADGTLSQRARVRGSHEQDRRTRGRPQSRCAGATSTPPVPAASGCCRRTGSISARSACRRRRRTAAWGDDGKTLYMTAVTGDLSSQDAGRQIGARDGAVVAANQRRSGSA